MAVYRQNGKAVTYDKRAEAAKKAKAMGGTVAKAGGGQGFVIRMGGGQSPNAPTGGAGGGGQGIKPGKIAQGKNGVLKFGTEARAEQVASGARFGVNAQVVKLGGKHKGQFGIKYGRTVSAAERTTEGQNVDRDDVVGFYTKPPKDIDPNEYRVLKGKYGQGYVVERRDELTGIGAEDREGVAELDKNTAQGNKVFDEQGNAIDATTQRITDAANSTAKTMEGDLFDVQGNAAKFAESRGSTLEGMRQRLESLSGESTASQIEQDAEARIAELKAQQGQGGKADVTGLAQKDDATAQTIEGAQQQISDAEAEGQAGMDWENVIRGEAKARADAVRLQSSQEAQQLQQRIASAEQENALAEQQYVQSMTEANQQRENDRKRWSEFQQGTAYERGQVKQGMLDAKRAWGVGRADQRLARIDGIRTRMREEQAARVEQKRKNEEFRAQLSAQLRGQDLGLLGTQFTQQGNTERALIDAETDRRGQDIDVAQSQEDFAIRRQRIQADKDMSRAERQAELRKVRTEERQARKEENQQIIGLVMDAFDESEDDNGDPIYNDKTTILRNMESQGIPPKRARALYKKARQRYLKQNPYAAAIDRLGTSGVQGRR